MTNYRVNPCINAAESVFYWSNKVISNTQPKTTSAIRRVSLTQKGHRPIPPVRLNLQMILRTILSSLIPHISINHHLCLLLLKLHYLSHPGEVLFQKFQILLSLKQQTSTEESVYYLIPPLTPTLAHPLMHSH